MCAMSWVHTFSWRYDGTIVAHDLGQSDFELPLMLMGWQEEDLSEVHLPPTLLAMAAEGEGLDWPRLDEVRRSKR